MSKTLLIRPATEQDLPFVVASWCDSYRDSHAAGMCAMEDWNEFMSGQIKNRVLTRPECKLLVACHPGETSESKADLYGWVCYETSVKVPVRRFENGKYYNQLELSSEPLLHYVYVKQSYRRLGIARTLLKGAGIESNPFMYTCKTALVKECSLFSNGKWKPLLVRYRKE